MSVIQIEVSTVGFFVNFGKHAERRNIFQIGQENTVSGIVLPHLFHDIRHRRPAFVIDAHIFYSVLVYICSDGNKGKCGDSEYTEQRQNEQDIHNKMFFLLLMISIVHMSETPLVSTGPAKYSDFRKKVAAIIFIVNEEAVLVIQQSVMLLQIFQRRRITAFYGIALGNAAFQCGFQTFLLLAQSRFTDGADAPQKKNKQYHKGQNGK